MKVLVADDDAIFRRLVESSLKKWDYEPVTVSSGEEALTELMAEDAPRLAIVDWIMPGTDGVEVCRKVKGAGLKNPPHIIILTSKDEKSDLVEALDAGADDYITKPFDFEELHARVGVGRRVVELQSTLSDRVKDLQKSLDHVKLLQGVIPICMYCKSIRNDRDSWERMEKYIIEHSEAQFSHGICPDCMEAHHAEYTKGGGKKKDEA
ncbi:MAG: response regulator transcription factor [Thermodesulfobacteriota bacterium]